MGIICLTSTQEEKLRNSHEDFQCPMGHVQGFYGKSKDEKRIAELERQLKFYKDLNEYRLTVIADLRADLRSAYARISAKTRKLRAVA